MLVRSSNMDLVFLMMVSFSIQGHSTTQLPEPSIHSCNKECPPGYHKGNSDNPFLKNRCKKCGSHTFTAKCNSLEECLRCNVCGLEVQPCSFNSDVVCECKEGFYNARSQESLNCLACRDSEKSGHEQQKCEAWFKEQCLKNAECKRKCTATTAAVFVATLTTTRHSSAKQNTSSLNPNQLHEAHSRPDSSPATVTFDVFEETLMTAACQSSPTPAHLDHNDASHTCSPHKDDRVEEPSGRWPPNVLYVIINEVPLRRWKEFLRMLSVADQQVERVEFDAGLGLLEKQYQMLRLWSQRSSASLEHIFSALHSMNLSGCAQMLQESLERLQRHDQTKDEFTAC
ncbi:tumor necrosis factor receptor superfamily member 1A isoform X3 [Syngnathoides biaculeatus]|uniref:tumor necrosis factor receptor superfamily member 1A isoform X3 n=1 Tax=Syngnathoides biaculeatus TaxID=300417 RepID=UPI002ADE59A8|nr:tumor necrosis factor receptor superfamily member 1A isoform X3 [Syngnathoides biaculeatus]